MLHVSFKAAGARFAIPAREVEEITPLVELAPLPGAPPYVAGLMNHRGASLPVADMTWLLAGRASRPFASTRILVGLAAPGMPVGLMAERVLRTMDIDPAFLAPPGAPAAPYVAGVATDSGHVVQVLTLGAVLPPELLASLKAALEAA
jgi:chemotaxis signal transduction protein